MAGRRGLFRLAALAGLLLAGALPAVADSRHEPPPPPPPKRGPVEYLKSLLPWTEVGPASDFVRESRPSEQATPFIPVGAEPADQELQVKSAAELAASKAAMEQARAAHADLKAHPPALTAAAAGPPPPPPPPAAAASAPTKASPTKSARRNAKRKRPAAAAAAD